MGGCEPQSYDHMAEAQERGTSHRVKSMLATRWKNCRNVGTDFFRATLHEITLLEPGAVLYGPRLRSNLLSKLPPKSFRNTSFCRPRNVSTTGVALHLTSNQAHVLKKLHSEAMIAEKVREKIHVPAASDVHTKTSERTASPAGISRNRKRFHGVFAPFSLERRGRQPHTTNCNYRNSLKPNLTFVRLEKRYYATTAATHVLGSGF